MPPPNRLLPARPLGRSSFERMKHRRLSALSPCAADNFVPWLPLHRASLFAREYRRAFATLTVFKLFFPPPPPFSFFLNISLFSSIFLICLFIYFFFLSLFVIRFSRDSVDTRILIPILIPFYYDVFLDGEMSIMKSYWTRCVLLLRREAC